MISISVLKLSVHSIIGLVCVCNWLIVIVLPLSAKSEGTRGHQALSFSDPGDREAGFRPAIPTS